MPIPLSITLLAFLLPFIASQSTLEFLDDNTFTTTLKIPQNDSETRRLDLPSVNAILRLEWTSQNPTAYPSTLFYLSDDSSSPIRLFGNSLDHNPAAANHTCNITQPCATVTTIDFEAFYTRSSRSFLKLPLEEQDNSDQKTVYVTVFNYQLVPAAPFVPSSPATLEGVLSARIVQSEQDCPAGPSPNDPVCSSRGKCVQSRCECNKDYGGRACETRVIPLPTTNEPPDETFLIIPPPNSYTARINLFSGVIFSAEHRNPGTALRFDILLLRARLPGNNQTESREAPVVWLFHAPPPLGQPLLERNVTLPTLGHPTLAIGETKKIICASKGEEDEDTVYLGFYALPVGDMMNGYALVNINQTETSQNSCTPGASALPLGLALVPAFLVTTAVAATGVLVMVWLDCRHGFTNRVDRLSNDEIERMYPSTPYRGDVLECPICISEIEPPQQVRNLKCNHVYHTECLDPWLTGNRASCPTCRTDVRVEQLSDKRHMRRIVQFFLAPLVFIRRLRESRSGPPPVEDTAEDLEAGEAGASLNPETNIQHENTDINHTQTANDTSAAQPSDATSQSPVTGITR